MTPECWLSRREAAIGLAGEDVTDLAGAAVWGLVRSAQTEHPGRIVLVDSDAPLDDDAIATVLALGEPQVLLRGGKTYTARVHGSRAVDGIMVPPGDGPWRLGISSAGTFENLYLEPVPNADAPLEPGQVRVALRAIAANFRDVMITLGMFTHDALLGGEGAGVVVEVGPGVTEFAVGDSVYGFFPDGSGTLVAGDIRLLVPKPADWSYAEAAAISAVFTTAYMAFIHLADVKPGQRVLVHAAAGGVGMAAVQLAGIWAWRCSVPPAAASGTRCGPWALTTTTSRIHAAWSSRTSSGRLPAAAAWTWCWTRWPANSSMPHCVWSPPAACSWRWARPTSATPVRGPGIPGRALPRLRPLRARPSADAPVDAGPRRAVRRRRAESVAGDDL